MLPKSLKRLYDNSLNDVDKTSSKDVFYVRGFQRSGTNWVCNLLNLHFDVNCTGEFHLSPLFIAKNKILKKENRILAKPKNNFVLKYNNFILSLIQEACNNYKYCGDRTPCSLDSCYISGTKTILIQRDGRDVLISWIYHLFRINHKFGPQLERKKKLFQKDPNYFESNKHELLNNYWTAKISREWNNRIIKDHRFYQNLTVKERQNISVIKYEDLIINTDNIRRDLYKFIGANPDKAKKLDNLTTAGFKEHNPNSHYRLGRTNRWNEYFTKEQSEIFEFNAKEALNLLKYPI